MFVYRCDDQGYMYCTFAFEFNEDMGAVQLPKYKIWIVFFEFKEEMIGSYMMLIMATTFITALRARTCPPFGYTNAMLKTGPKPQPRQAATPSKWSIPILWR